MNESHHTYDSIMAFLDGYCSTLQGLLDWFEVDLGFTKLSFIQIGLCVLVTFMTQPWPTYDRVVLHI